MHFRQADTLLNAGNEPAREHLVLARDLLAPLLEEATLSDSTVASASSVTSPLQELSEREREVLRMVADGKSTNEISHALDVAASTVSTYRKRIREKTGVESLSELIALDHREQAENS